MSEPLEDYVHGLLNEEAGEICQEVGKALRFGMDTRSPMDGRYAGTTPRERLYNEAADMEAAVIFAKECGFTGSPSYQARVEEKLRRHRDPDFRAMKWSPSQAATFPDLDQPAAQPEERET